MSLFYNIFAPKIASGSECYLTFIFMLLFGMKKTITGEFLCYTRLEITVLLQNLYLTSNPQASKNGDRYV